MKLLNCLVVLAAAGLAGCLTLSGSYEVTAKDRNGQPLSEGLRMTAQGSGIYTWRNALCSAHSGAIVTIIDLDTGKELTSESPYHCR